MGFFKKISNWFKPKKIFYSRRKPIKILEADTSVENKIRLLYCALLNGKPVGDLDETLQLLEMITNETSYEDIRRRRDLITLESIVRTRKSWEDKKRYDCHGKVISYIHKKNYSSFVDYLKRDRFLKHKKMDADIDSPYVTEEGTFHYSSLLKYMPWGENF